MKVLSINNYNAVSFGNSAVVRAYNGLRDIPHLHCARCGHEMLSRLEVDKIYLSIAKDGHEKASKTIQEMRKLIPHMGIRECNFLILMSEHAQKYPDLTFEEILKKPEIIYKHSQKVEKKNLKHQRHLDAIFNKMRELLPQLKQEDAEKFAQTNICVYKYSKNYYDESLKKYLIASKYQDFISMIQEPKKVEKFKNLIRSIPLLEPNEDNLICKYKDHNIREILQSLMRQRKATLFHIDNALKSNQDQILVVCEKCNTEASLVHFGNLFKIFPDILANLKRYMADICKASEKKVEKHCIQEQYLYNLRKFLNLFIPEDMRLPSVKQIKLENFIKENPQIEKAFNSYESLYDQGKRLRQLYARRANLKLAGEVDSERISRLDLLIELFSRKYSYYSKKNNV